MIIVAFIVAGMVVCALVALVTYALVSFALAGRDDATTWREYRIKVAVYDTLTRRRLTK